MACNNVSWQKVAREMGMSELDIQQKCIQLGIQYIPPN